MMEPSTYTAWIPSFSFCVFADIDFTRKKELLFFGSGLNWAHVGGFWDNNSSKQRQIEMKFLPQVVLIVVQIPSKEF